ncbi:MAG: hypothetical protein AB1499_02580 [Nitrospirota bacterium]
MSRNLKIFMANGVPFGICMGILFSSLYGPDIGLPAGLISGLVLGAIMFVILGLLHGRAVRKVSGSASAQSLSTFQNRSIKLPLSFEKSFDLSLESLGVIRKCRVREQDRSGGIIVAESSVNWKTWGDTISIELTRTGGEETGVRVSSRPTSWSTIVDYGKNLDNVEKIISFLKTSEQHVPR